MSKLSRSLSRKLSLNIMLMAVPVFVLSLGFFYYQSRQLLSNEAAERTNSILRTTVQRVSNYMSTVENSTNANAWMIEERFTPDSLQSVSRRIVSLNPNILSCSVNAEPDIFPQYGRYFSVYTIHDDDTIVTVCETDYEYYDKPWYKEPLNTGKACWVDPFSEYTEGLVNHHDAVATYCRPLCSDDGKILGVISADFSFSQLAKDIIATEHPYPSAYFILLDVNGRYLIHPDTTRLFRKTIFTDADPTQDADMIALGHEMIEGRQGTMHVDVNGKHCHVCYSAVPGTDWSLAMVCPDDEVLTDYRHLIYVIAALILIGLLVMWWLSNKVVRETITPIKKLLGYTQQIAGGNYNERIPRSEQNDDIGRLQNGFVLMQQALHEHMGKISSTAEEIKKRNEKRARDMELAEEADRKKTLFVHNLSHQMRMPLNIIGGFANVLLENIVSRKKDTEVQDAMQEDNLNDMTGMMKYNAIHLKRMILMLFDISSANGAEELMNNRKDEVDCNEVARESVHYTEEHFKGIKIQFESSLQEGTSILTNHIYLMRTIREPLYNAAKFSDGKHIKLIVSETATTIRFTVEDVGPGLPEDADDLLFKPFIKIDDLTEGLGIGLPLTKRHAMSLGGDLIYDKDYKDGCRFIVEMPK